MDAAAIAEAQLELLRMRVHVHLQGIEREVEQPGGMPAAVAHVAVAKAHGAPEQAVTHHAAVHEQELPVRLGARGRRHPDPALQRQAGLRVRHETRSGDEVRADQASDARLALAPAGCRRQRKLFAPVVRQREGHVEAREREARDGLQDVLELGRFRAQELAPRRHTVKEVANLDRRALRVRGRLHAAGLAVLALDRRARGGALPPRGQPQPRHRRNRRQRLAAEPERGDPLEVLERGDLAGGMARQREREFVRRDAGAVVAHADQADPAVLDVDRELLRAGIEGVLDEFLDDGSRTLDDLARSDLVDERAFEDADGHGGAAGASLPAQMPVTGISRMVPEATVSVARRFFWRRSSMLTA